MKFVGLFGICGGRKQGYSRVLLPELEKGMFWWQWLQIGNGWREYQEKPKPI